MWCVFVGYIYGYALVRVAGVGVERRNYGKHYVLFLLYVSCVSCENLGRRKVERSDCGSAVDVGGRFHITTQAQPVAGGA